MIYLVKFGIVIIYSYVRIIVCFKSKRMREAIVDIEFLPRELRDDRQESSPVASNARRFRALKG